MIFLVLEEGCFRNTPLNRSFMRKLTQWSPTSRVTFHTHLESFADETRFALAAVQLRRQNAVHN
jgi:hypothetical protein